MKTFKQLREAENSFINPTVGPLGSENAVDTPDAAIFDVASPESIRLLNVYLSQVARGEPSFNPYDRVRMVQKKMSTVGLNFTLPHRLGNKNLDLSARIKGSLMGQWKEVYPLSYLGGRTGVLDRMHTIGTDDNISHRTGYGLMMVAKFTSYGDDGNINLSMKIVRSDDPSLNEGYYADKFKARYKDAKNRHFATLQKTGKQPHEVKKRKVKNKYNTKTTKSKSRNGRSSSIKVKGKDSTTTTITKIKKGHGLLRTVHDGILSRLSGAASATLKTGASMAKDAAVGGAKVAGKAGKKAAVATGRFAAKTARNAGSKAAAYARNTLAKIKAKRAKNTTGSTFAPTAAGRKFAKATPVTATASTTTKKPNSPFTSTTGKASPDPKHTKKASFFNKRFNTTSQAKKPNSQAATSTGSKSTTLGSGKSPERKALPVGGQGASTKNARRAIRVPGRTASGAKIVHTVGSGQKALPVGTGKSTTKAKRKATNLNVTPINTSTSTTPKEKPAKAAKPQSAAVSKPAPTSEPKTVTKVASPFSRRAAGRKQGTK